MWALIAAQCSGVTFCSSRSVAAALPDSMSWRRAATSPLCAATKTLISSCTIVCVCEKEGVAVAESRFTRDADGGDLACTRSSMC
ncbi:hypothetical protein DFP72DRAFT_911144, partial [Ephemerocybe angulata]